MKEYEKPIEYTGETTTTMKLIIIILTIKKSRSRKTWK
jgi:hypothetical protein